MIGFSYQISPTLKTSLQKIEHLRRQILLAPLPPKIELRLRWETMIDRLYWSLTLSDNPLTSNSMAKLFSSATKKLSKEEKEVVAYKKALDYISQEWLVSPKTVSSKTVVTLHDLASAGSLKIGEGKLKPFLDYIQVNPENPIILAGIAQMQMIQLSPFTAGNGRIARLLALLFLYKYGYDFRGMLCLEEYFRKDITGLRAHTEEVRKTSVLTSWLEFFAQAAEAQLEKAAQQVLSPRFELAISNSFWELNDRQKEIMTKLEEPNSSMTNKKVQKFFGISQITASRDLTKLATLGLLFPRGKGRSVCYTRV